MIATNRNSQQLFVADGMDALQKSPMHQQYDSTALLYSSKHGNSRVEWVQWFLVSGEELNDGLTEESNICDI